MENSADTESVVEGVDPFGLTALSEALEGDDPNERQELADQEDADADAGTESHEEHQSESADSWTPPTQEEWQAHQDRLARLEQQSTKDNELFREFLSRGPQSHASAAPGTPTGPAPSASPASQAAPQPDFDSMPDPIEDPAAHRKWWAQEYAKIAQGFEQMTAQAVQSVQSQVAQRQQEQDSAGRMERFFQQFPEMRGREQYVTAAADAAGLTSKDSESEIFRRTAEQLRKDGLLKPAEQATPQTPSGRPKHGAKLGVMGAGGGGTKSASRKSGSSQKSDAPTDFVDALMDAQIDMKIA